MAPGGGIIPGVEHRSRMGLNNRATDQKAAPLTTISMTAPTVDRRTISSQASSTAREG